MRERLPRSLLNVAPLAAVFALACALLAPASPAPRSAHARAPQRQSKQPPPADSTVFGRAVYDDTSRPVRRGRVMLVGENGNRTEYNALTDGEGDFRIEHVRAGTYFIFADVPGVLSPVGFVSVTELRAGAPDFTEARKFFDVVDVDGKQETRVTVRARRGGAIGGKVTYADGDPAVNLTINVMRRGPDGRLATYLTGANFVSVSGLRTDDRGMFRVSGLPPGEYSVGVSERAEHGGQVSSGRDDVSGVLEALLGQQFLMTYYPSATSAKEAAVVKVDAGVERADIDITIPERALRVLEGVVRGRRDKRPVANAKVSIIRRDDDDTNPPAGAESMIAGAELSQNTTRTDEQGRWRFKEIPDGDYRLFVKPSDEYEEAQLQEVDAEDATTNTNRSYSGNMNSGYVRPRRKKGYAPARRDVRVSGGDLSDVALELSDGGQISGTVMFEGGVVREYGFISVRRVPAAGEASAMEDSWGGEVAAGRFDISGMPAGKYFLHPYTYDEGEKFYVKAITWNGRDILREPLELAEGATADGVRVVMSKNPSTLRVRATDPARKEPANGVFVVLVPSDVSEWSPYALQLSCSTEEDGACTVNAPPGNYQIVAMSRVSDPVSFEAELRRRALAAPRVALAAGETKDLELVVSEK